MAYGPAGAQENAGRITYDVTFSVPAETDLEDRLEDASNLEELKDQPVDAPEALLVRARAEPEYLIAALQAEARYGAVVRVTVAGVAVDAPGASAAVARAAQAGPVPIIVTVEPGPEFKFQSIRTVTADGRPSPVPIDLGKAGLTTGEPARSADIIAGERAIVRQIRETGRPLARVAEREAVVNHSTSTMDLTIILDPGAPATFGEVTVSGTDRLRPEIVAERAPFATGEPYSPAKIARYREKLSELAVFKTVRIVEGDQLNPDGSLPIRVEVAERPRRYVGAEASYSTSEGAGVGAYWGHRNLFGGAEGLRLDANVSRLGANAYDDLEYKLGITFTKPSIITPKDDLTVSVLATREAPDAYTRVGVGGVASIKREITEHLSVQAGIEVDRSRIDDVFGRNDYTLIGIPLGVTWDNTDSKLDPTEGFRAALTVTPFPYADGSQAGMTIAKGQVSAYRAIDDAHRFVVAGRIGAGTALGAEIRDLPANRRFFAGGGGSIRGYTYQSVSPRLDEDTIIGGRSLLEGSLELRVKVTDKIGIVPFVDAGAAFDREFPDFNQDIQYAAGLGLRYYTAIGPIRADVAFPLNPREDDPVAAFYISLGQAF
ncbi:autotransporter assembly complex protein TamA [Agaricicola taiwanensis]|nr:autotransporter assembly complex family protein [Agaricicola taiwanensis]